MDALFVNHETMMSAEVEFFGNRRGENKYRVTMRDLDADLIVYPQIFYPTLEAASVRAKNLVLPSFSGATT
jgi:hypothetical protein